MAEMNVKELKAKDRLILTRLKTINKELKELIIENNFLYYTDNFFFFKTPFFMKDGVYRVKSKEFIKINEETKEKIDFYKQKLNFDLSLFKLFAKISPHCDFKEAEINDLYFHLAKRGYYPVLRKTSLFYLFSGIIEVYCSTKIYEDCCTIVLTNETEECKKLFDLPTFVMFNFLNEKLLYKFSNFKIYNEL